ncbi:hypothetical protein [Gymnodinialimonas sp.]
MTETTKLQYNMTSTPNPVQVSDEQTDSTATLEVVASNPQGRMVTVESIQFTFAIGSNANQLSNLEVSGFTLTLPKGWTRTISGASVIFTPLTGSAEVGPDGLMFTFEMLINNAPGTTPITITEIDASGGDPGTTTLSVSKFPLDLTIVPISADPQVLPGPNTSTQLSWDVSGSNSADYAFTLSFATATKNGSKTVSASDTYMTPPLVESTLFTLTVQGTKEDGGQINNTSSVFVPIGPPLVTCFTTSDCAEEVTVNYGEPAELVWTTQNATNVQLKPSDGSVHIINAPTSDGYAVYPLTKTSYTLSAEYKDGSAQPRTNPYGDPVIVKIAPPVVTDMKVVSVEGGNFVNCTYQLTYEAQSANYVCLTTSPDQKIAPAWYPVTQTTIDIPTPKTQGVEYTLTGYQLTRNQIAIIKSGGAATEVLGAEAETPASVGTSVTLTFEAPAIQVATHSFPADPTKQTYAFPVGTTPTAFAAFISGFYFVYEDSGANYISTVVGRIVRAKADDDTVTVNVSQLLSDEHDPPHTISDDSYIDVQLIWLDGSTPDVLSMAPASIYKQVTMPAPEVTQPTNGLYSMSWYSNQNKISGFNLTTGTPVVSKGNVVKTNDAKFEVDHSGSAYGPGEVLWTTIASLPGQPGGIDWQSKNKCNNGLSYEVSGTAPIESIVVIPTGFFVSNGSSNENFHSMQMTIDVQGSPGDTSFFIRPTMYWHKSTGDGYTGQVDCDVLIIYQVPD